MDQDAARPACLTPPTWQGRGQSITTSPYYKGHLVESMEPVPEQGQTRSRMTDIDHRSSRLRGSGWPTTYCVDGEEGVPMSSMCASSTWPRQPWSRRWTERSLCEQNNTRFHLLRHGAISSSLFIWCRHLKGFRLPLAFPTPPDSIAPAEDQFPG